jgi:hypothetical protein
MKPHIPSRVIGPSQVMGTDGPHCAPKIIGAELTTGHNALKMRWTMLCTAGSREENFIACMTSAPIENCACLCTILVFQKSKDENTSNSYKTYIFLQYL